MKKLFCVLIALVMSLSLFGCENKNAMAVEELINAIGEVTLESGEKIAAAEGALAALDGKDRSAVLNIHILEKARIDYQGLVYKEKAREIEELIHALRPITMNSADALSDAEDQYNSADINVKLNVENFADLVNDFQLYRFLMIDLVEKKITAIGEVTLDSGEAIEEAVEAYNELSEEDQTWVYNNYMLRDAIHQFGELQKAAKEAEATGATEAK